MSKCTWKAGCKNQETVAPKIYIPAKGHPAIKEQAIAMIAGIKMCRACCKNLKPQDFIPDLEKFGNIAARMSFEAKGGYLNLVDVDRAWVVPLDLASDEYREFEASGRGKPS